MGIVMDERVGGERRGWRDDHFEVAKSRSAGNTHPVYPIYSREEKEAMRWVNEMYEEIPFRVRGEFYPSM